MKLTLWQRLDLVARQITPFLVTLLLVMLALVPLRVPNLAPIVPWLALVAVYYWTVYRPDLMPPLAVFGIGLFHDLATGTNVGVGALLLLLVHVAVLSQRRFFVSRSFLIIWIGFSVIAAGAMLLMWMVICTLEGELLSPRPVVFQYLITVAAYPPMAWLFTGVQRWLLR